ncbi:MAG: 23S rRNA (uracil(1939)-C(5))-methyltransferase RlmD [Clostridiales bacterium]|nr:23S rRNA (uracil(1939)-C(5))-methyltransferase RlmD [Clostridiales bacterium]
MEKARDKRDRQRKSGNNEWRNQRKKANEQKSEKSTEIRKKHSDKSKRFQKKYLEANQDGYKGYEERNKETRKNNGEGNKEFYKNYEERNKEGRKNGDKEAKGTSKNLDRKTMETRRNFDNKPTGLRENHGSTLCPYAKKCGGCNYIDLDYKKQLKKKQKQVKELLGSFGTVEPIIGMSDPYHYRNKVHGVVAADRKGNGYTGIYEEKSHRIIRVDSCLIENQKADEIMQSVAGLMKSFKMKPYNEDTGYGFLRHILIRTGYHTGQIMVVLVTVSPVFPSKNNFVKALLKLHPEITTIVANVNDRSTSMVLGDKQQVLYGKGYIEDILCGKRFRISPKSFYQVNPVQTEVLYKKAIEYASLTGKETVIDAYSGIGTIGMVASDTASRVISVELNGEAVRDAVANAKMNQIKNIQFYKEDAGDFMVQLADQKQKVDVVFMDPPRSGSDEKFMDALLRLAPRRVVYISCNPETQKRDLTYLTKRGYQVRKIQPVDMFPMTGHVETIVLMSRVSNEPCTDRA